MRLPRAYASDDGAQIACHIAGTGPPILLLHGLGGSADFWQPVIRDLVTRHTVIAPDLLGFGFSDKPPTSRYTPERHAQAVQAVLRTVGTRTLDAVVAHSCGGVIAMTLLAAGVASARRLALAASAYPSPRFPVRQELLRSPLDRAMLGWPPLAHTMHRLFQLGWPLLNRLVVAPELRGAWAGYMDHTIASYVGTAEACLFEANIEPLLPALHAQPTLLLYGRTDQTVPLLHGERLAAVLPRSSLHVIAGDHYAVLRAGRPLLRAWLAATQAEG